MVLPPEIYDGAQFTLRYKECNERLTDYYEVPVLGHDPIVYAFGFEAAWQYAINKNYLPIGEYVNFSAFVNNSRLIKRLELRNMMKELSAETPDEWFMLCVRRWCEVAVKYEDIVKMEETQGFDVSNPNKESRIIEYGHIINGQVQDTPYGELDSTSDYVTGKTAEQHSGEDKIHERNELDAEILMDLRKRWDATVNKIIEEFDVLFVRITGAGFVA